jgi:hypothetical protein
MSSRVNLHYHNEYDASVSDAVESSSTLKTRIQGLVKTMQELSQRNPNVIQPLTASVGGPDGYHVTYTWT